MGHINGGAGHHEERDDPEECHAHTPHPSRSWGKAGESGSTRSTGSDSLRRRRLEHCFGPLVRVRLHVRGGRDPRPSPGRELRPGTSESVREMAAPWTADGAESGIEHPPCIHGLPGRTRGFRGVSCSAVQRASMFDRSMAHARRGGSEAKSEAARSVRFVIRWTDGTRLHAAKGCSISVFRRSRSKGAGAIPAIASGVTDARGRWQSPALPLEPCWASIGGIVTPERRRVQPRPTIAEFVPGCDRDVAIVLGVRVRIRARVEIPPRRRASPRDRAIPGLPLPRWIRISCVACGAGDFFPERNGRVTLWVQPHCIYRAAVQEGATHRHLRCEGLISARRRPKSIVFRRR
jgi:hypothetical protein